MLLKIKVIVNAKKNQVEKKNDGSLLVYTSKKPEDGKANEAVIKLLAEFLDVAKSKIIIKNGEKSRNKIIGIHS